MSEIVRPLVESDADALLALQLENRLVLAPYMPERDDGFFTLDGQRQLTKNPSGLAFAILDNGALAGVITLSNLAPRPFLSASVGYWIDHERSGRGLATAALAAVVAYAFDQRGLHRVEAATLTNNLASQRVLEKNRFERIGLARRYLHIAGAWRDHILFQRTIED